MTTVKDICDALENGHHVLASLEFAFDIPRDTEINRAIERLDWLAARERSKRDARHWSFSPNLLIALTQHRHSLGTALMKRAA